MSFSRLQNIWPVEHSLKNLRPIDSYQRCDSSIGFVHEMATHRHTCTFMVISTPGETVTGVHACIATHPVPKCCLADISAETLVRILRVWSLFIFRDTVHTFRACLLHMLMLRRCLNDTSLHFYA